MQKYYPVLLLIIIVILSCQTKQTANDSYLSKFDPRLKSDIKPDLLPGQIKLQHLVRINYQDPDREVGSANKKTKTHSFHGYFFKNNNDFKIIALGPFDVPIFQLEMINRQIQYEFLNEQFKPYLENKLNLQNIALDLWKIYFAYKKQDLIIFSEKFKLQAKNLKLQYNNLGFLQEKTFLDENNNILINIYYQNYKKKQDYELPEKIHFRNLSNQYEIIIIMI